MKSSISASALLVGLLATFTSAASWSFDDAQLTVKAKSAGVDGGLKEKLSPKTALTNTITLTSDDALKITLTTKEGTSGKKPHQAFLTLQDTTTGLEDAYPLSVKENGKAKVEITHKDIPQALLVSKSLQASVILASFGSSTPYRQHIFDLTPSFDSSSPMPSLATPERLALKEEIHHIFKAGPKSPARILSLAFTLAVLGTLPVLLGIWAFLGANLSHASEAFGQSPIAHGLFFGSIIAMEAVFFLYYTSWNLFQTLPAAAVVGLVAYISGSRALTEVQERRSEKLLPVSWSGGATSVESLHRQQLVSNSRAKWPVCTPSQLLVLHMNTGSCSAGPAVPGRASAQSGDYGCDALLLG